MPTQIAVNGRYRHRRLTGVDRYAAEISLRLFPPSRIIKPLLPLPAAAGHAWEQFVLPMQLRRNETLWSPANSAPWILHRQAVTLHDASVFDHPEWFKSAFGAWTRLSWRILAKRARVILTVSDFSGERLQLHLKIPAEKLHVVPNGVGRPFEPQSDRAIDEILAKYDLKKPYFLFVGTLEPRKNLSTLVEAWGIFSKGATKAPLVLAGAEGRVFAPVGRIGPRSGLRNLPHGLGYVPDSDLPALYSGAVAVVSPSVYEGFGLTALEAMACGAPVIVSNTTSFPEVIGDAGIMVNPSEPNEIANAMSRILEDTALADVLREKGLKRVRVFTWDESARKIQTLVESL